MGYNGGGIGKFFTYIATVHNYIWLCIVAKSYKKINFLVYPLLKYIYFCFISFPHPVRSIISLSNLSPLTSLSLNSHFYREYHRRRPTLKLNVTGPLPQPTLPTHATDPSRPWSDFWVHGLQSWYGLCFWLWWLIEFGLGFWLGWSQWTGGGCLSLIWVFGWVDHCGFCQLWMI